MECKRFQTNQLKSQGSRRKGEIHGETIFLCRKVESTVLSPSSSLWFRVYGSESGIPSLALLSSETLLLRDSSFDGLFRDSLLSSSQEIFCKEFPFQNSLTNLLACERLMQNNNFKYFNRMARNPDNSNDFGNRLKFDDSCKCKESV